MELAERRKRYQAIEDFRKRPLIVYATSTRLGIGGQMSGDAVREFMDQIDAVSAEKRVDILIHSTGGDALAAWKLMSMFREKFDEVAVLVPFMAFSAATLFTLGADEIVMHPHASLGPIDPQVTITLPDGSRRQFSYEDVGAFLRFLMDEVRITEQVHISAIVDRLFSTVDPLNVGAAKRASELSSSVGERLLLMHMKSSEDKARARQIAENLNKSFFAHGDAVSRSRARELNLKVAPSNPTLEALLWAAYLGIEGYMELRKPFSALQHYLADPQASASLRPIAPLSLPPNAPPQLAQKVWEAAAQQVLGGLGGPAVEVEYSVVNALIESTRTASEFRTKGRLSGQRAFSGEIQLTGTDTEGSWRRTDAPSLPRPNPLTGAASA
jgi:Serine dehydrogenase proteinase